MKRTCNGCRALDGARMSLFCNLGYKTHLKALTTDGKIVDCRPDEECEKPTTIKAWLACRRKRNGEPES